MRFAEGGESMDKIRCGWVKHNDETYINYHDQEWGKPLYDDTALFELFSLETQTAGLSWLTVLKKREGYREVFHNFCLEKVIKMSVDEIDTIVMHGNVIKSRSKLIAILHNAQCFVNIQHEYGSLCEYFWHYVNHQPIVNLIDNYRHAPITSLISDQMTKDLKKRGFKYIGSTTLYAFMQACGMVNDHEESCWCKHLH